MKKVYKLLKDEADKFSKTLIIKGSGVNTERFKNNKTKKVYDIIFHSRILYDKGFLELINAIRNLKKKREIKVLVLGDPDQNNRASVEINKLKQWEREELIIWKSKKINVIPFLLKSRVAVLPSYREGLPKTLLEAASCELPIISTNVPGCREICLDKFNGFLVKPKDSKSLAKAIEKLVSNQRLINKFGKNGRNHVIKNFANELVIKKFREVYKSLLE